MHTCPRIQARLRAALLLAACIGSQQLYATPDTETRIETARFELASALERTREQIARLEGTEAIAPLEQAIRGFEIQIFRDAPELAEAWMWLGDAYLQAEQIQAASNAYEQSIHITRVNRGLFTLEQLETLYRQARLLETTGDLDGATAREEYALVLQRRQFGRTPELVPSLNRLAGWYLSLSEPVRARQLYDEAISTMESAPDKHDTTLKSALIDSHVGIANAYRMERFPPDGFYEDEDKEFNWRAGQRQPAKLNLSHGLYFAPANRALLRAEALLAPQADASDAARLRLSTVRIALGDLNMLFERWGSAEQWYKSVFALWEGLPEGEPQETGQTLDERLHTWFGNPVPLHLPLPKDIGRVKDYPPERIGIGSITLAFSLSPQGKVERIKTLDMEPDRFRDLRFRRILRESRFRPRIEQGVAVSSEEFVHRHEFLYVTQDASGAESGTAD